MSIDLSGPLHAQLKKEAAAFRREYDADNLVEAKKRARSCQKLLKQLAKNDHGQSKKYNDLAQEWNNTANKLTSNQSRKVVESSGDDDTELITYAETLISQSRVNWEDVGGLDQVKKLMKENIAISSLQKPDSIKPWKGILLFGPPGTGKTLLAAAAATGLQATFFDVKVSKILSKFFGESSKLISALYSASRLHAPSIVFIDEFDSLSQTRNDESSEATRKMLSSLLTELDGFENKKDDSFLLTMAATNTPWALDPAILSRFPQRIYVTLPDQEACEDIIKLHTRGLDISSLNFEELRSQCVEKFYSGRDILSLCQQAIWNMIRSENPNLHTLADLPHETVKQQTLKVRQLSMDDFKPAFEKTKSPLTKEAINRYINWNKDFGS